MTARLLVFGYGLAWLGWYQLIRPRHPGVQLVVSAARAADLNDSDHRAR